MNYNLFSIIKLFCLLLFTGFTPGKNSTPQKILEKKGIVVYDLGVNMDKNHFKALYYVNADKNEFIKMILNSDNHVHWLSNVKSTETVKQLGDSLIYTRVIIGVQSILRKEAIVKTTVHESHNPKETFIIQEIDSSIKYDSKYNKLNAFTASWTITSLPGNKIKIELGFLGTKADYPDFIDNILKSILVKKLYKLAYKTRKQIEKKHTI